MKERIGLIKKEDHTTFIGCIKQPAQILLGLADIFAHHCREINAVQVETQIVGDHLGSHGLSRTAFAGKESVDTQTTVHLLGKPPLLVHFAALAHLHCNLL